MKDLLKEEREAFEKGFAEDQWKKIEEIGAWLTAHDHRILTALKEEIEGKKLTETNWKVSGRGSKSVSAVLKNQGLQIAIDTINSIEKGV